MDERERQAEYFEHLLYLLKRAGIDPNWGQGDEETCKAVETLPFLRTRLQKEYLALMANAHPLHEDRGKADKSVPKNPSLRHLLSRIRLAMAHNPSPELAEIVDKLKEK